MADDRKEDDRKEVVNADASVLVTDIDRALLKACLNWDPNQPLEELEELRAWIKENPRNLKVVRVFEGLLHRERLIKECLERKEGGGSLANGSSEISKPT